MPFRRLLPLVVVAITTALAPRPVHAQQDGPGLLRRGLQSFLDFDNDAALPLLRRGLNMAAGPQDSLWAHGVQAYAQILFDADNRNLATLWARVGMRFVSGMQYDSANLSPEVLGLLDEARGAVAATADDPLGRTQWIWPSGDPAGDGRIQVQFADPPTGATAVVVGRGVVTPQGMSLAPGIYQILVTGQGYRQVQIAREVLPGITTAITFNLSAARQLAAGELPVLVRDETFGRTAGILVSRFGSPTPTCAGGIFVGRDGLLLTSYRAIRGADRLEVVVGPRRHADGIQVAAYDVAADLAVLTLPAVIRNDSTLLASLPTTGSWAFRVSRAQCAEPAATATRVAAQGPRAAGFVYLADSMTGTPLGSPFVNEAGALIGVWDGPSRLIPADRARPILGVARGQIASRQLQSIAAVAATERHAYGTVQVQTAVQGATASVVPLEPWAQWPELSVSSPLPMIYAGPAGRYRLTVRVAGVERESREFVVRAGVADVLNVTLSPVAATPTTPGRVEEQRRGGGFPWIIAAVGGLGAGVAALVLMGGGGGTGTTGGITITVPNQ